MCMRAERRIRVTVTLSPRVVQLLDKVAVKGHSRSQVVEQFVLEQVRTRRLAELRQEIDDWYSSREQGTEEKAWLDLGEAGLRQSRR